MREKKKWKIYHIKISCYESSQYKVIKIFKFFDIFINIELINSSYKISQNLLFSENTEVLSTKKKPF
jgi:hypothetical protein